MGRDCLWDSECDLCEIEDFSKLRLKIHKAKWHTNVAPMYGNITTQLAQIEKYDRECLICRKKFYYGDREKHIREDHDFITEDERAQGLRQV